MFRYNPDTQTYSMSLFEDSSPDGSFSKMDERQKQLQEIALRSTFKIITEPEFHDLWFCETRDCENSFWLGGRHHCRMCGNTVCEEHCHTNVVLSTHLMPVIEDKLPNVTATILAASRLDAALPETLEFKRACLSCCEKAKHVPLKLWIENEKERLRKEEQENLDRSRLGESHWTADEALTAKIQAMKVKKIAWCQTNSRRRKKASRGEPLYDSEGEEYFEGDVRPQKTLAQQIAERAEKRLHAAKAAQEAALAANAERQAQLAAHAELLKLQRKESMTPAELALYQKQLERAQAEAEKNAIAHQVDSANEQMKTGMASVFFSIAKRSEIAAQQEELRVVAAAAQVALSKSTRHIFDRLTLNREFQKAKVSGDVDAMHRAAVGLIGLAWQVKVDRKHRAALKLQREELLRKVSLGRIQAWWYVMLARLRALKVQQLKQNLHNSAQEILRMRILDLMSTHRMDGIRSIVYKLIGQVRMKLRLASLPRVLVVEGIVCSAPASSQHVLVHHQTGLTNLSNVHTSGRGTLLHKSKTECVYKSRLIGAVEEGVFSEKCVLAHITGKSVVGVTLVNTDSYTQTLIPLSDHPALLKGETVTITKPFIETAICPVINPYTHKSYLPATNIPKSSKVNKKLTIMPSVRTFRMYMLPHAFTHTGRVQKQANSVIGEFKSRFLVLAGGKLLYYEDSGVLHKPRSVMNCSDVTAFAFGPDKVPTGELTLYLSDGVQHWYLRFPKSIGTVGISEWLRKIQYSVGVSINNTSKSFIERIEQMSQLYTYPVLRPVLKDSGKKGVFDDSTGMRDSVSIRDSGVSNRNSTGRNSVGNSGSRDGVGASGSRNSTSGKGIVFGSSTSNKLSWGVFSMRRNNKPNRGSVGSASSNGGGVHGHIGYSSDTSSGAYTPTTPAVFNNNTHTTPNKTTTTFSTSTGKYKSLPSGEEKGSDASSPNSFARTPGTNNTTSTNNGNDTYNTANVNNTSTYGDFDGSADHTLHLPWQQPTTDNAITNNTTITTSAEPKHADTSIADYSIEHKRSFINTSTNANTTKTANNNTSTTTTTNDNHTNTSTADVSSPRSPPAKPPKTKSFVASDNQRFLIGGIKDDAVGDSIISMVDVVDAPTISTTTEHATPGISNADTIVNVVGDNVTTLNTSTKSATVNTEASTTTIAPVDTVDTTATATTVTTNIITAPTTSPIHTARAITITPNTTTPNNTSSNNLAFTLYQPRNNPLFMSPKRKSSGMLFAGLNSSGVKGDVNGGVSSYDVNGSGGSVSSAADASLAVESGSVVSVGGSEQEVVAVDTSATSDDCVTDVAAVVSASNTISTTDAAVTSDNNADNTATTGHVTATSSTDTSTTATPPLPALPRTTSEVETVEWSDSEDEHEIRNMNINSAYTTLRTPLRTPPVPVAVSAVPVVAPAVYAINNTSSVANTNANTTNTNPNTTNYTNTVANITGTESPRVYAVPVSHSEAVSANLTSARTTPTETDSVGSVGSIGGIVSAEVNSTTNIANADVTDETPIDHSTSNPTSPVSRSSEGSGKTNKKKKKGGKK